MARRTHIPLDVQEKILALYAENGSMMKTAAETGTKYYQVRDLVHKDKAEAVPAVVEHRALKRLSIIDEMTKVQLAVLRELVKPARLAAATNHELVHIFTNVTDKRLLLTGDATHRIDIQGLKIESLTAEEMEQAANIRAKLQIQTLVRNQDLYEPVDMEYELESDQYVVAEAS